MLVSEILTYPLADHKTQISISGACGRRGLIEFSSSADKQAMMIRFRHNFNDELAKRSNSNYVENKATKHNTSRRVCRTQPTRDWLLKGRS